MKKYILFGLLSAVSVCGYAQQDAQYTLFMFNKLGYNPAYAGSKQMLNVAAIYRKQWIGMNGSPQTASLNIHSPILNQKLGLGLSVSNDQLGLSNFWNIESSVSYRIPVGKDSYLSIGARGTVNFLQMRWDKADPTQIMDGSIPAGSSSKVLPNFGAGLYYDARNWYVGLSAPRLFQNNIDFTETNRSTLEPRLRQHYFLMGGVTVTISDKVKFQPNVLMKYTKSTPFDMDLNASFIFSNRFLAGLTYRLGDSFDGMVQFRANNQITISASYDYTLTRLQRYNSGSVDVMIEYNFYNGDKLKLHNPRFFQ